MGQYTRLEDCLVDEVVERHLQRIVAVVRSHMEPEAIILRGSFGRGEGSILVENGRIRFLSDYEVSVVTPTPRYRSLFAELSRDLSQEFGVDTGLRWWRPDFLQKQRIGPVTIGLAPITISLYEARHGSRTLYGKDLVASSPSIDPIRILPESGVTLLINRMAESLYYMPGALDSEPNGLEAYYWVNKTVLACAESLLLLWGRYHFSYEERGRRFATEAQEQLAQLPDFDVALLTHVTRATEFKLRPRRGLYTDPVRDTWLQVVRLCGPVFRHLSRQVFGLRFAHYAGFPGPFLEYCSQVARRMPPLHRAISAAFTAYKYVRMRRLPRALRLPFGPARVVQSVVPLIFLSYPCDDEALPVLLAEVRQRLSMICKVDPALPDPRQEWALLRQSTLWAWKNFCYL